MSKQTSSKTGPKRVVLYARLSVTTEESVSIERQLAAGRSYCAARGWTVVDESVDDGVSATKNKPEDRKGWRALLDLSEQYDAVVCWKVDRLARRVLDFLHADQALQERGAGIVCVEDPVDMTTAQGRAFATMLAVFAEMEAAAISARVTGARHTLVRQGRRVGGRPPYGWMNQPNKTTGYSLTKDPERIGTVEKLVGQALDGRSLYKLTLWMDKHAAARPDRKGRKHDHWPESSVEAVLRNPVLAGLVPFQPGRKEGEDADPWAVLRDENGQPVRDESVAIMTIAERRRLLGILDASKRPRSRGERTPVEPGLLSGVARCGSCDGPLYRAVVNSDFRVYRCQSKTCVKKVSIGRERIEAHVIERMLSDAGEDPFITITETVAPDTSGLLADLDAAITETATMLTDANDEDMPALVEKLRDLKVARDEARKDQPVVEEVSYSGRTLRERWEAAQGTQERAGVVAEAVQAVRVMPGRRGRSPIEERVDVQLVPMMKKPMFEVETVVA